MFDNTLFLFLWVPMSMGDIVVAMSMGDIVVAISWWFWFVGFYKSYSFDNQ